MPQKFKFILYSYMFFVLAGCAVLGEVIHTPVVSVAEVKSQWITPTQWKLICPLWVKNPNPLSLSYNRLVYITTVNNKQIQTKIIYDLPIVPSYEKFTYEIPVVLNMDTLKSALLTTDKTITFNISGQLFPTNKEDQSPISFDAQSTFVLPVIPTVVCKQLKRINKNSDYACLVEIKNKQTIPIQVIRIDGICQVGNLKLNFNPLQQAFQIKPGETKRVQLIANYPVLIQTPSKYKIQISGEIEAGTEIGKLIIPFQQELKNISRP